MTLTMSDDHIYRFGGIEIPSVTQIIQASIGKPQIDPKYLIRGRKVHELTVEIDNGTIDFYPAELQGYVDAYSKWLADRKPKMLMTEKPMYCYKGYAGTIDRLVEIDGLIYLPDYKCGMTELPQYNLQINGGYRQLLELNGHKIDGAFALHLKDGKAVEKPYENTNYAIDIFNAMLDVYNWKKSNNLLEE